MLNPTIYPVKNLCPPLEGDALEDGEHGLDEVVEVGDAVVGAGPVLAAHRALGAVVVAPARDGLLHHLVWNRAVSINEPSQS